jgi:hypothetical protein
MILVAGGNIRMMEEAAWSLYRAGHVPVLGEWFAWPLVAADAESLPAERAFEEIITPVAERLLVKCDAILSVDGTAAGVESLLALARARGLRVYYSVDDALAG